MGPYFSLFCAIFATPPGMETNFCPPINLKLFRDYHPPCRTRYPDPYCPRKICHWQPSTIVCKRTRHSHLPLLVNYSPPPSSTHPCACATPSTHPSPIILFVKGHFFRTPFLSSMVLQKDVLIDNPLFVVGPPSSPCPLVSRPPGRNINHFPFLDPR